jgi:ankyrin repeat protein
VHIAQPLIQAAMCATKLAVVKCLVKELGADVNGADEDGFTPLFVAAQEGHEAVVLALVKDLGATVDQVRKGCTPLYAAAAEGHKATVLCLVKECGADIN